MSRQAKKALTQVASLQNPAAIHAQRKSILLNKAGSAVATAGASAAGLTGVKAPYLSSLADVSKSLTKEKPKEQAEKKAPQAAPPVTAPEAPIEKPKQVKDVPKDETKEAAKEEPSAQEPKGASAKEGEEKGQTSEKGAKPKKPSAKEETSPKSPDQDPAFQSVVKSAKKVSKQQGKHEPTGAKVSQAKAAAKGPPNEVESQAKDAQIKKMDGQEPGRFDKAVFKAALLAKITSITPKNLEEADDFKKNKKASSIKNDVTSEVKQHKEGAQGSIEKAATQPPDPSAAKEKEQTDLAPVEAGPAPPDIGGQLAAPKPKTESEVSLEEGSQNLDRQMEEAEVTEEQLTNSNEPQFQEALASKKTAQQHAKEAPVAYRQDEQGLIAVGQEQGAGLAQQQLQEMHQSREAKFNAVHANQTTAVSADEQKRQEVATNIEKMYTTTKEKVEARLKKLDDDVNRVFNSGIEQATKDFEDYVGRRMSAYKDERYDGVTGKAAWVYDKVAGMPEYVNTFYVEGKDLYLSKMDVVIDEVATLVETGLNEAKDMIAAGRQEIKTYVEGLDKGLQDIGKQAAADIDSRFDELSQSLDEKNNQLIDSLSKKYVDNLNKVDERINQMKAENKGLVDKALDAVVGIIKTILKLKDMLLGVLAKVASVVTKIIKNPIGFVGNLVKGVKKGLDNFVGKIGDYLKQGLFEWLFGALAGAGIQVPESLDFKGVLSLVMQVLGLTYPAIRARAVKILGEGVVKGLEQASEIFTTLVSEGPAGLWKYIQEKIADLKDTVIEGIKSFLIEKVIMAGVTWIIGLLNPASAFIKAAKAIYDIVMFFVTRGSQIMSLVDALIDSMGAIAEGGIGVAAAAVEKALGKAVPVVIGFLASLLGLGGVSEKISGIIKKVQAPVNKAVDWVINKAASSVKSIGKMFGKEKKDDTPKSKVDERTDAQKREDIQKALAESHKLLRDDNVEVDELNEMLPAIKNTYRLKTLEPVVDSTNEEGELVHIHATLNPEGDTPGVKKEADQGKVEIDSFGERPDFRKSTKKAVTREEGEDRRHIDAWMTLHERLKISLNGRLFKDAVKILRKVGHIAVMNQSKKKEKRAYVAKENNESIRKAGYAYLKDQFNFSRNLWAGDSKENQQMGSDAKAALDKVYKAIELGNEKMFEEQIALFQSNAYDPDKKGSKAGFVNLTSTTVRELRKKFRENKEKLASSMVAQNR